MATSTTTSATPVVVPAPAAPAAQADRVRSRRVRRAERARPASRGLRPARPGSGRPGPAHPGPARPGGAVAPLIPGARPRPGAAALAEERVALRRAAAARASRGVLPDAPRPRASSTVRLTVRGRRLVALLGLVAVLACTVLAGALLRGLAPADELRVGGAPVVTAPAAVPVERPAVRIRSGETLWQVAQRVAPQADARDVVGLLRDLNDLQGSVPQAGQRLVLPLPHEL